MYGLPEDLSLDEDGHPLCQTDLRMCSWNYDKNKCHKFRCPLACGHITEYSCASECSKSAYERTVHIQDDYYAFCTMIIGICIHLDAWYKNLSIAEWAS